MRYFTSYESPLGRLTLACEEGRLTGLWTEGQQYFGGADGVPASRDDSQPVFHQAKEWLDRYFRGEQPPATELPLQISGSAFRQRVYQVLLGIPYGRTMSYRDIAARLNAQPGQAPTSARAVGGAVGHNPLSILIPCHRVVGADGGLTGYAGGLARKQWLLRHEGADV